MSEKIDRLDERAAIAALDEQRRPLVEASAAALTAYGEAEAGSETEVQAEAALDAAEQAVRDFDEANVGTYEAALDYDEDGLARRCVLTGLVLLDDDEIVEDSQGRQALAAAIEGWPFFDAPSDSPAGSRPEGAEEGAANDDEAVA